MATGHERFSRGFPVELLSARLIIVRIRSISKSGNCCTGCHTGGVHPFPSFSVMRCIRTRDVRMCSVTEPASPCLRRCPSPVCSAHDQTFPPIPGQHLSILLPGSVHIRGQASTPIDTGGTSLEPCRFRFGNVDELMAGANGLRRQGRWCFLGLGPRRLPPAIQVAVVPAV